MYLTDSLVHILSELHDKFHEVSIQRNGTAIVDKSFIVRLDDLTWEQYGDSTVCGDNFFDDVQASKYYRRNDSSDYEGV